MEEILRLLETQTKEDRLQLEDTSVYLMLDGQFSRQKCAVEAIDTADTYSDDLILHQFIVAVVIRTFGVAALDELEIQIVNYEGTCLSDAPYGNAITGFTTAKQNSLQQPQDAHCIFSNSSTWNKLVNANPNPYFFASF
eukprot:gene3909-6389_t